VWAELAEVVGMTALLRNVGRMTAIGAITPGGEVARTVARRLRDRDALHRGRIHPMDVFLALRVYQSGRSQPNPGKPPRTWMPVAMVTDHLEEAFDLSFGHTVPTGKRLLVAVDSSGSMSGSWGAREISYGGSPLGTPYEVANTMALILARTEPNVHVIDLDTTIHASEITPKLNLRSIPGTPSSGGGTDLSLPFVYADQYNVEMDGVVVLTDGETWAGARHHPSQALDAYRRSYNPNLRVVVAAMAANGHTIREPGDVGVLNAAGLDSSLPQLVAGFIR
jgi:60 kDa SS-A/Ro ribonucleoprotein